MSDSNNNFLDDLRNNKIARSFLAAITGPIGAIGENILNTMDMSQAYYEQSGQKAKDEEAAKEKNTSDAYDNMYGNMPIHVTDSSGNKKVVGASELKSAVLESKKSGGDTIYYDEDTKTYSATPQVGISFDSKTGDIKVKIPKSWKNDEYIKSYANTDFLKQLSSNYKTNKNVSYQDPYDENKKYNTEEYVQKINEALNDRAKALNAVVPVKNDLSKLYGGTETKDKLINSIGADQVITMSATGLGDSKYISIPAWLQKAWPGVTKLPSYNNGYALVSEFKEAFLSAENPGLQEGNRVADNFEYLLYNSDMYMDNDSLLSTDDEDGGLDDFARNVAFNQFVHNTTPDVGFAKTAEIKADAASRGWFYGTLTAFEGTMNNIAAIVSGGTAGSVSEFFHWDPNSEPGPSPIQSYMKATGIDAETTAKRKEEERILTGNTLGSDIGAGIGSIGETLAEISLMSALTSFATEKITTAALARGASTTAETMVDTAVGTELSSTMELATEAEALAFEQASVAELANSATKMANLTTKTKSFLNLTLKEAENIFTDFYGGTKSVIEGMNIAQKVNILNTATKSAKLASGLNSALGVMSDIIVFSAVSDKNTLNRILTNKATDDETKSYITQVLFSAFEAKILGLTTGALMETSVGQQLSKGAENLNEAAYQGASKVAKKVTTPWLRFREWFLKRKMETAAARNKPVSNATRQSYEAVKEAELRNVAREYTSTLSTEPAASTAAAAGTLIGGKNGIIINPVTGELTQAQMGKAAMVELENNLTDRNDIEAVFSQLAFQIADPNIEPVTSAQVKATNDANTNILKLEMKNGMLSKDVIKLNKQWKNDPYGFRTCAHSQEVSDYAFVAYKVQHEMDICITEKIPFEDSPALKEAQDELAKYAENVPVQIQSIVVNDLIPSIQQLSYSINNKEAYEWHIFPRELLEGLRKEGKWGKDGKHYIRLVSRETPKTGIYETFDNTANRINNLELNRAGHLDVEKSTWIGYGPYEMLREAAHALAAKGFRNAAIKSTGLTPEVVMSGKETSSLRKLKEYRVILNNALQEGFKSFSEDLKISVDIKTPSSTAASKEANNLGGLSSMDISEVREIMSNNKILTTESVDNEASFLRLYQKSSPEAKNVIEKNFPNKKRSFEASILDSVSFVSKNKIGQTVTVAPHAYGHFLGGGVQLRPGTAIPKELAASAIYNTDFKKRAKDKRWDNAFISTVTYGDVRIDVHFGETDGNIRVFDVLVRDKDNLNAVRLMSNKKTQKRILSDYQKFDSNAQQPTFPDYSSFNRLKYSTFESDIELYNNICKSIDIDNAMASKKVLSSAPVKNASNNYSDNEKVLEDTEIISKTKIPGKYEINEDLLSKNIDEAINGLVGLVESNSKASAAVSSIIELQGGNYTPIRAEFTILENILNEDGKKLFGGTISEISKSIVNEIIPSNVPIKPTELNKLYNKVETLITDKLESRLASDKRAIEAGGEKINSSTVTEILDKYNTKIVGYKADSSIIKTTDANGEIQYERVTPLIAELYNSRPVYKPMGTAAEIFANAALMKRISLTNLSPRSFAKQSVSDPLMAYVTVGVLPGTGSLMDADMRALFGDNFANELAANDPFRYENILAIAERDGISFADAALKEFKARTNIQLPFTTMSREALTQANINKYGTEEMLKRSRKSLNQRINKGLRKVSEKLGKPNDLREEYNRKLAGEKAYIKARKQGYTIAQAEEFKKHAIDNATTNFRQKHTMFNNLRSSTPYLTSGISGAKSFWKMFELDPLGVTARILNGFILPIIYFLGEIESDDEAREKYKNISQSAKDNHIAILVDGEIILIPVGEELGTIVNPINHTIEELYGLSKYDFWQVMLNDAVGLVPVDLTGFTDPEMWNDIVKGTPSFLDVMENGVSKMLAQTMPPVAQSAIMATTGRDLYTGNKVNTSYVSVDDDGNAYIQSYSQSQFAKALANVVGGDARVIEKVTSGIFGTTTLNTLDTITSAVKFVGSSGEEGSLLTGVEKALSDLSKPFATNDYGSIEKQWQYAKNDLYDMKEQIEDDEFYKKYNEEISRETDPQKRATLKNKRNDLLVEYQKRVSNLVKWYRNSGGSLNNEKFATVTSLLTFEDAVRADRMFMDLNTTSQDAKKQAMQTLDSMGISNPDGPSMLGYIYKDSNGKTQVKMWNPAQIQVIYDAYYNQQGDIHKSRIESIIDDRTENSLKNQRKAETKAEQKYWDKYNSTGKLSDSEWDAIDDLRTAYNAKVVLALQDYMDEYGAANILSNDEVMNYLVDEVIKVPSGEEKVNNRFVSSGGGVLNKQEGFGPYYIKKIFGVAK